MCLSLRDESSILSLPNFRSFLIGRFFAALAGQIFFLAVGWHIYSISHRLIDLGYVGLVGFIPFLIFTPVGGHMADMVNRRWVIITTQLLAGILQFILAAITYLCDLSKIGTWPIFLVLFAIGAIRAFSGPALTAVLPSIVPAKEISKAVGWNSGVFQLTMVIGPSLGGLIYGFTDSPTTVYLVGSILLFYAVAEFYKIQFSHIPSSVTFSVESVLAGLNYLKKDRVLLGAVTLDLFAVLFGGCKALLPPFTRDVLNLGPEALGILRAAPAFGALCIALYLARNPLGRRAGSFFFAAIIIYGLSTVTFALSTTGSMAFLSLLIGGAADMVSVVLRQTLIQLSPPEDLRGRVSALSQLCIGASNELGEFESGVTAAWFGLIPSIIIGGVGACSIGIIWAKLFPELRKLNLRDNIL